METNVAPPAPQAPAQVLAPPQTQQEADDRWDAKIFGNGVEHVADALDPRRQADLKALTQGMDKPGEMIARMANLSYVARNSSINPGALASNWDAVRDQIASSISKTPMSGVSDTQLYGIIGESVKKRAGEQEMLGNLGSQMLHDAIVNQGGSYLDTFHRIQPEMQQSEFYDKSHEDQYLAAAKGVYEQVSPVAAKLQPVAQMIADHFNSMAETSDQMGMVGDERAEAVVQALKGLSKDEQHLALQAAVEMSSKQIQKEETPTRPGAEPVVKPVGTLESARRGIEEGATNVAHTATRLMSMTGSPGFNAPGQWDDLDLHREVRSAFSDAYAPQGNRYQRAWYGFSRGLPQLAPMIFQPELGMGLVLTQMADQEMGDFEERGMTQQQAFVAGIVAAAPAAAVMRVQEMILEGHLFPFISRFLDPSAKSLGMLAGKAFGHLLIANTTILNTGQAFQDASIPGIQEIAHRMDRAIPGVDWKQELSDIKATRLDTFLTLFPLALVGAGGATLREGTYMRSFLRRTEYMRSQGFTEAQIKGINWAKSAEDASRLIREAWKSPERARTLDHPISGLMASPNTSELTMSFNDAVQALHNDVHQQFHKYVEDLAGKDAEVKDAVGDWVDGSENSVAVLFNKVKDEKDIEQLAARVGLEGHQKSVLHFVADKSGSDTLYDIHWDDMDLTEARERLKVAGLDHRTLIKDGDGVRAMVYDQGDTLTAQIATLASHESKPKIEHTKVRGEFLGADDRDAAAEKFRAVIGRSGESGADTPGGRERNNGRGSAGDGDSARAAVAKAHEKINAAADAAQAKLFVPGGAAIPAGEDAGTIAQSAKVSAQVIADKNEADASGKSMFHVEQKEGEESEPSPEEELSKALDQVEPGKAPSMGEKVAASIADAQKLRIMAMPQGVPDWLGDAKRTAMGAAREMSEDPKMARFRTIMNDLMGKMQRNTMATHRVVTKARDLVPDEKKREGITNWIQANGDMGLLKQRMDATKDAGLKAGYKAAMNLTPEEIKVAEAAKQFFAQMLVKMQAAGLVKEARENYVTQMWKRDFVGGGGDKQFSAKLNRSFAPGKEAVFGSYFEGEQAGFKPVTKDISSIMGTYLSEANKVIATREFLKDLTTKEADDSSPEMRRPFAAPFGGGTISQSEEEGPSFIRAMQRSENTSDYKVIDNSAMRGWKWLGEDAQGNPVMMEGQLGVHPEIARFINALVGRDRLRDWYNEPSSDMMKIVKGGLKIIDAGGSEAKGMMFTFSGYHQVQESVRALGARVNPFTDLPELDEKDPMIVRSTNAGLMLAADHGGMREFMEGYGSNNPFYKIPGAGDLANKYSEWFFKDYLPRVKQKTWMAVTERNAARYTDEIKEGKMTREDVDALSASQVNALYGHLNYVDLGRSPTARHLARIAFLAPDFLESTARVVGQAGKALVGNKAGFEPAQQLAFLAITQWLTARILNQTFDGNWHNEEPFGVIVNGRTYSIRTIPGDLFQLAAGVADTAKDKEMSPKLRSFMAGRLSPIVTSLWEMWSGTNYRGENISITDSIRDVATNVLPMTLRPFLGKTAQGSANVPVWDQFLTANGLRISRNSDLNSAHHLGLEYAQKVEPKEGAPDSTKYPVSRWQDMRYALEDGDLKKAQAELDQVKANMAADSKSQKKESLAPTEPKLVHEFRMSLFRPFTGDKRIERDFEEQLKGQDKATVEKAVAARDKVWSDFLSLNLSAPESKD